MSIDVTVETEIAAPREAVAAYAADPANDQVWIKAIREVRWVTEPPLVTGSRIARVAHFLGRRLEYIYEVTDHTPGERVAMRAVESPFPMTTTYEFTDAGEGTRMRIIVGGEGGGFFNLAKPLLEAMMRRNLRKDLANIKAELESATN